MKRKSTIIVFLFFLIVGAFQATPVLAMKDGQWSQTLLEKISLYRTLTNANTTKVANAIISITGQDEYLLPSSLVQSHHPEIKALAYEITKGSLTDEQKSKAIYHWVASNITYDVEEYVDNPTDPRYYDSLETLRTKVALCSGYAHLNAALHRAIGIRAKVVYGEGHAWNEIFLAHHWQAQDPTYGAGGINMEQQVFIPKYSDKYFASVDLEREGVFPW